MSRPDRWPERSPTGRGRWRYCQRIGKRSRSWPRMELHIGRLARLQIDLRDASAAGVMRHGEAVRTVTDQSWFDFLSASAPHDEVNFWAPFGIRQFQAVGPASCSCSSCTRPTTVLPVGVSLGHASNVPLSLAWDAFGSKNGVETLQAMRGRNVHYRRDLTIRTGAGRPDCRLPHRHTAVLLATRSLDRVSSLGPARS